MQRQDLNLTNAEQDDLKILAEAILNPGTQVKSDLRECFYELIRLKNGRLYIAQVKDGKIGTCFGLPFVGDDPVPPGSPMRMLGEVS